MRQTSKRTLFLGSVILGGFLSPLASYWLHRPDITTPWLLAFFTLLILSVFSALLTLKITEGGTTTSLEFLPQLGAIPLLGTFGAVSLTLVSVALAEFVILQKDTLKASFNTAQVTLSVAIAAFLYSLFGATPSLFDLDFIITFPPFVVAATTFFALNSISVAYIIALTEGKSFYEVFSQATGITIVFDVAMSPLAYLTAFLYIYWGPVALLAAVVPIIGLRYAYGVNIELQQLNQDLLRVLVKTLEARDRYTSGHSIRVAERSRRIAREIGCSPKRIRTIETAALLHDIGKIDLAYGEILRQAGPLTPPQRDLIKAHPDKGVEILQSVRSIDPDILRCVRHHHEWFDGSGYPLGIRGDAIPLGARIIMISDSIDAMLTDRPYRSALSIEDVRQELIRNSGRQFDPDVVDAAFAAGVVEPPVTNASGELESATAHRATVNQKASG